MVQVAQNILGLAVEDVIQNNLQSTPNRFLQTYLDTAPTVNITPTTLDPLVLFAGASFTSTADSTQTITLTNTGNDSVSFNVSATPTGLFGGWITVSPTSGKLTSLSYK